MITKVTSLNIDGRYQKLVTATENAVNNPILSAVHLVVLSACLLRQSKVMLK
jgi:hypothetical protein